MIVLVVVARLPHVVVTLPPPTRLPHVDFHTYTAVTRDSDYTHGNTFVLVDSR